MKKQIFIYSTFLSLVLAIIFSVLNALLNFDFSNLLFNAKMMFLTFLVFGYPLFLLIVSTLSVAEQETTKQAY